MFTLWKTGPKSVIGSAERIKKGEFASLEKAKKAIPYKTVPIEPTHRVIFPEVFRCYFYVIEENV